MSHSTGGEAMVHAGPAHAHTGSGITMVHIGALHHVRREGKEREEEVPPIHKETG